MPALRRRAALRWMAGVVRRPRRCLSWRPSPCSKQDSPAASTAARCRPCLSRSGRRPEMRCRGDGPVAAAPIGLRGCVGCVAARRHGRGHRRCGALVARRRRRWPVPPARSAPSRCPAAATSVASVTGPTRPGPRTSPVVPPERQPPGPATLPAAAPEPTSRPGQRRCSIVASQSLWSMHRGSSMTGRRISGHPHRWLCMRRLGQDLASLNSRPWATSAQMTKMSRVMMSSDQNG
jgi:hypothetical protein